MNPTSKKGGAITSFFKPAQRTTSGSSAPVSQPPTDAGAAGAVAAARSPPPPSPAPVDQSSNSDQATPTKPPPGLDRNHVFAASDDEDADDDDDGNESSDLEDLMCTFNNAGASSKPQGGAGAQWETPKKAKRLATGEVLESPLSIRHKFDFVALADDARRDELMDRNSRRLKELQEATSSGGGGGALSASRDIDADTLAEMMHENGGDDAHKVLRAVQRSEPAQAQRRYCFFVDGYKRPGSGPVPPGQAVGPWKLLLEGSVTKREQYLASGIPYTVVKKGGVLSDDIFNWLLDDLCVQKSVLMQQDYCYLLSACHDNLQRLAPERLEHLFFRLGAKEELDTRDMVMPLEKVSSKTYEDRDWRNLKHFLQLLALASGDLPLDSIQYAIQVLLRMAMDRFLLDNADILAEFEFALLSLLQIDKLKDRWDEFCYETALLMFGLSRSRNIQLNILTCIPARSPETHDMRRRLALTFLFDDLDFAENHPDGFLTLKKMIERIKKDDFQTNQKTEFPELRALVLILDVALDDGSFIGNSQDDEEQFNAEADELSNIIQIMWTNINDIGMKMARTEVKVALDLVQKRISQTVRTRRKVRKGIFDLKENREDKSIPQQRNYMRKFLGKATQGKAEPEASGS